MENNAFEEDFADATSVLRASNAGLLKMSGWDHRTVGTPNDLDWPGGMEDLKSFADRVKAEANAELLLKVQKPCPITSSDEFLHPPRRDTLAWGDGTLVGALGAADDTMSITPSKEAKARFAGAMAVDGNKYPVVIITWAHYLGPPGPSTSQILGTFLRFSEDYLGRERDP